jgi:hypothetical protein
MKTSKQKAKGKSQKAEVYSEGCAALSEKNKVPTFCPLPFEICLLIY